MPATWVALESGNPMLEGDGSIAYIPIEDRIYRFDMKDPNNPRGFRLPKDIIKGDSSTGWSPISPAHQMANTGSSTRGSAISGISGKSIVPPDPMN